MTVLIVKKSPAFCGTRKHITAFTKAHGIHIEPDESSVLYTLFLKRPF